MKAVPRLRAPEFGETPLSLSEIRFGIARQLISTLDRPPRDCSLPVVRRRVPVGAWACEFRTPSTPFTGLVS